MTRDAHSLSSGNGLTNGSALSNSRGLTNGSGLVNGGGLVNGNGLINGNGLVNGNGLINGNGLVNGNGLTNGISRLPIGRNTFGVVTNKDLRVGLTLVMLAMLIIPVVSVLLMEPVYEEIKPSITIDGDFSDWEDVPKYTDKTDARMPDVTIYSYAIDLEGNYLSFYVQAVGIVLGDITGYDAYYFFIDSESDSSTGYKIRDFGADYVIQVYGGDNIVEEANLHKFSGDDQTNWSAFTKTRNVFAEVGGRMMEVQTTIHSLDLDEEFTVLFCANDYEGGQSCSSVPIGKEPGALLVEQRRVRSVLTPGIQQIMQINFTAKASDVIVNDVTVVASGGVSVQTLQLPFTVAQGTTSTKFVLADLSSEPVGALITASVQSVIADRPPTIRGEMIRTYIEEIPPGIVIDGFFDDWGIGNQDPVDSELGSNIDITEYDAVEGASDVFFHVKVAGEMMQGTTAPQVRKRVFPGEAGEPAPVTPIIEYKVTGEDYIMIYIDSNSSDDLGEMFYGVRANTIVEIRGIYGAVKYKSLTNWMNGSWEQVAGLSAQNDMDEIEISIVLGRVGMLDNPKIAFVTSTWNMISDVSLQQTDWRTRSRAIFLVEQDGGGSHVALSMQRKIFYTGSYFFAFYYRATQSTIVWEWSDDGEDWSNSFANAFQSSDIYWASVWYNSSDSQVYIVGSKASANDHYVFVRAGSVTSNTITWGSESSILISARANDKIPSIAVSSGGYVWVASEVYNSTGYNVNVTRSVSREDVSSFGTQTPLTTDDTDELGPVIVPLSDDDMYCVYNRNGVIKGNYYDSSSGTWNTEVTIASDGKDETDGGPSVVVDTLDNIHLVYADTSGAIKHVKYTGSWGSPNTLGSTSGAAYPTISLVPADDLYAFWINGSFQITGMISTDGGTSWTWSTYITSDSNPKWNLTSVYNYTTSWGIGWMWDRSNTDVYFERIPEFEFLLVPISVAILIPLISRRKRRAR